MCDDVSKQRTIQTRGDYSEKEFLKVTGMYVLNLYLLCLIGLFISPPPDVSLCVQKVGKVSLIRPRGLQKRPKFLGGFCRNVTSYLDDMCERERG